MMQFLYSANAFFAHNFSHSSHFFQQAISPAFFLADKRV